MPGGQVDSARVGSLPSEDKPIWTQLAPCSPVDPCNVQDFLHFVFAPQPQPTAADMHAIAPEALPLQEGLVAAPGLRKALRFRCRSV